jgi:hypothetical protein
MPSFGMRISKVVIPSTVAGTGHEP